MFVCLFANLFTLQGAPVIAPLPGCTPMKPGSATFPFFGVMPAVVNDQGRELTGACEGHLVFKRPWPSIMRTVENNHKRFENTYFTKFPGYYWSGDGKLFLITGQTMTEHTFNYLHLQVFEEIKMDTTG